jgi:LPXTG-motif cell wall-anchored protein
VIRFPSVLRRPLAVAGAAFVGLAAAVAIAAPASAHFTTVAGDYRCVSDTGQWEVTWTVTNSQTDLTAELTEVTYEPAHDAKTIKTGATLPVKGDGPLHEVQSLPGDATTAKLSVKAVWTNGHQGSASKQLEFQGTCEKKDRAKPGVTFTSACDGSVLVKLDNPTRHTVVFTVNGKEYEVAAGQTVDAPVAAEGAASIVVTWGEAGRAEGKWEQPDNCPTVAGLFTCDKLSFEVVNFEGNPTFEVTFKPSVGEAQTLEVQPGETKTVSFDASKGFTVEVIQFGQSETVAWEEPNNCGGLPVTGPQAGAMAGGAGALLAIGSTLFVFARRRRIRFTAA